MCRFFSRLKSRFFVSLCLAVACSFLSSSSSVQATLPDVPDVPPLEYVGGFGGVTTNFIVAGNIALGNMGGAVVAYDFSDPTSPQFLTRTPPHPEIVQDICITNQKAVVAAGDIFVYDISDARSMKLLGVFPARAMDCYLECYGDYVFAYIYNFYIQRDDLVVLDISNPQQITQKIIATDANVSTMAITSTYLFVFSQPEWFIYDISNPAEPVLASIVPGYDGEDALIVGNLLYFAASNCGEIYDVSSPVNPRRLSFIWEAGKAVAVSGNYAYFLDKYTTQNVLIIDVSDPAKPVKINSISLPEKAAIRGLKAYNNYLVVAVPDKGFFIYNVEDPLNPRLVHTIKTYGSVITGVSADSKNNYIYLAAYTKDFTVIRPDFSIVSHMELPYRLVHVAVRDNYAFILTVEDLLLIYDVSDLSNPVEVSRLQLENYLCGIGFRENIAYVGGLLDCFYVVDLSDIANPQVKNMVSYRGGCEFLFYGDYMFVLGQRANIFSIKDPENPVHVKSLPLFGDIHGAIVGNKLFITEGYGGITVYDITNPESPEYAGYFPEIGEISALTACNDVIYTVADCTPGAYNEFWAYLVALSLNLEPLRVSALPEFAWIIGCSEDRIYVANHYGGLQVFKAVPPPPPPPVYRLFLPLVFKNH